MARETKTIQYYPDDEKINRECAVQASFGWELIGNQRCVEEKTYGEYVNTSTFHKLTFSREKSSPWYSEVTALEDRYNTLTNSEPVCYADEPGKTLLFWGIMGLVFGLISVVLLASIDMLGTVFYIPLALLLLGALFLVIYIARKVRYSREYDRYWRRMSDWKDSTGKEAEEIRQQAEAIVNSLQ